MKEREDGLHLPGHVDVNFPNSFCLRSFPRVSAGLFEDQTVGGMLEAPLALESIQAKVNAVITVSALAHISFPQLLTLP